MAYPVTNHDRLAQAIRETFPDNATSASDSRVVVYNQMRRAFNDEEINEISFILDIQIIEGTQANTHAQIRALITYCERTSQFHNLIALCKSLRPSLQWPESNATHHPSTG